MDLDRRFIQEMVDLNHRKSKFRRKINDLKALLYYLDGALSQGKILEQDCQNLQDHMDNLVVLKQDYESSVSRLIAEIGLHEQKEVENADKAMKVLLAAFADVKQSSAKMMLRLHAHLNSTLDEDIGSKELSHKQELSGEDSEGNESGKDLVPIKMKVVIGLLVVILFYMGLGFIISSVTNSWKETENGETEQMQELTNYSFDFQT